MGKRRTVRRRLRASLHGERIVIIDRVSRPSQTIEGFVVDVGRRWVLLQRTMDGGFFDGHVAIRLDEIRKVRENKTFESAFARTRPEWPPAQPHGGHTVGLDATRDMLASLPAVGQLMAIERNRKYDAMWIGVPDEIVRDMFYLREVRPDARWHEAPLGYRLRTITVAAINTHYLRGLAAIAQPSPS